MEVGIYHKATGEAVSARGGVAVYCGSWNVPRLLELLRRWIDASARNKASQSGSRDGALLDEAVDQTSGTTVATSKTEHMEEYM